MNFQVQPQPEDFTPVPSRKKIDWETRINQMTMPVWYLIAEYNGITCADTTASGLRKKFPSVVFSTKKAEKGEKPYSRIYAKKFNLEV